MCRAANSARMWLHAARTGDRLRGTIPDVMTPPSDSPTAARRQESDRLDSWKEIAGFMNRDVRTVQRWEKSEGLPVHRHLHEKAGSVYAYRAELEAWWRSAESKVANEPPVPADAVAEDPEEMIELLPDRPYRKSWFRSRVVRGVIAAVLLGVAGYWISKIIESRPAPGPVRIAVMPFTDLRGDPQHLAFPAGMTEELSTQLNRLNPEELLVVPPSTVSRLAPEMPVDELGKKLDAAYVTQGSVLLDGENVRIDVHLVRTKDVAQIWSESYSGSYRDVIDLQSKVAAAIAGEIKVRIVAKPHQNPQVDPQAYNAYLRGRYFLNKRNFESIAKSIPAFAEAVQRDANYAPAWAGVADTYALMASDQSGVIPPSIGFPKAKEAALKSIQLDPGLAEPHASLGYIALVYEHDGATAKKEFDKALELNPRFVTALQWQGQYFESTGKLKEALDSVQKAHDLEPLSLPPNLALAEVYYFSRDYDQAIAKSQEALNLDPDLALAHYNLGRAYVMKHMYDEGLAEFHKSYDSMQIPATLLPIGWGLARSGKKQEALAVVAQLKQIAQKKYVPSVYYAMIYSGLEDKQATLDALEKAKQEKSDYLIFLPVDPMADFLRDDARFKKIMAETAVR
jgi:TolB-like protein/Tfp pilus assembly protein PilF